MERGRKDGVKGDKWRGEQMTLPEERQAAGKRAVRFPGRLATFRRYQICLFSNCVRGTILLTPSFTPTATMSRTSFVRRVSRAPTVFTGPWTPSGVRQPYKPRADFRIFEWLTPWCQKLVGGLRSFSGRRGNGNPIIVHSLIIVAGPTATIQTDPPPALDPGTNDELCSLFVQEESHDQSRPP